MDPSIIPLFSILVSGIFFIFNPTFFEKTHLSLWKIFIIKVTLLIVVTGFIGWPYDIQGYFDHSKLIWQGNVPLKDFNSPYSIGFEYLLAFISFNYNSPLFMGISILTFEIFAYYIVQNNKLLSKGQIFSLAFNPLFLHFSIFDIQDEFIILFFVAWLLQILLRKSSNFYVIIVSILLLFFTKILSILFIVPLFFKNHKQGYLSVIIVLSIYLVLYFTGFRIFSFEFDQNNGKSDLIWDIYSAGNFFWLLKTLGFTFKPAISMFITAIAISIVNLILGFNRFRGKFSVFEYYLLGLLLNMLTLLIFYKMTFPYNYLIFIFIYLIAQEFPTIRLDFFSKRLMAIYVLVVSMNHQIEYLLFKNNLIDTPIFYFYYIIQIILVSVNTYLFCKIMKRCFLGKIGFSF